MSTYEQKDNSGSLFINDQKQNENQPDRKGSIRVNGVDYWISGWLKKTQQGVSWLSLSVTPKEKAAPKPTRTPAKRQDDDGDNIPW